MFISLPRDVVVNALCLEIADMLELVNEEHTNIDASQVEGAKKNAVNNIDVRGIFIIYCRRIQTNC